MRKSIILLILLSANTVFATAISWTGASSQDWGLPANWSSNPLVPTSADTVTLSGSPGPVINSGTAGAAASVRVNGPFRVNGGTLTTTGSWIIIGYDTGTTGAMTIDSGTVTSATTFYTGFNGTGTLTMNGGSLAVNGVRFGIGYSSSSAVGHVYLNSGTITCTAFAMATNGGVATMDITGGKLIINGDATANIALWSATNGWITGYGDKAYVRYDYNISTPLKTTVWAYNASALPTKATTPTPANAATNVSTTSTLTWSAGSNATSHDVYFGTTSPGSFIGNQTAGSYNPGTLAENTTYYWRIDEKNALGTATGDIWSFTTSAGANVLPKNIHLEWNENVTGTTMQVVWATLVDTSSIVNYGPGAAYGSQQTGTSTYVSACAQYIHKVELTGLTPSTTYHYSCGSSASWSADASFKSGMVSGDANDFTFAVGGDTRNPDDIVPNPTYAQYRINVMNTILIQQPRFFIFTGDYTDRGQYQNQWDEILDNLKPQVTTMSYMMVWGSHEDPGSYPNAFAQYDFPSNGVTADQDKYYSYDYGNAHFIVLYATAAQADNPLTEHLIPAGSTQYNWLQADLQAASANPKIEWKFLLYHAPPYSTATRSGGGSCVGLRQDLQGLIATYHVDAVFNAHEHNFERTHLINNDTLVQTVPIGSTLVNPQGTIYYVTGGAGAGLNDCDGNAWFSATHQNLRHFLLLRITGKKLDIKAIQDTGSILDEITIQHSVDGDFNYDGHVDSKDLGVFSGTWLQTGLWP